MEFEIEEFLLYLEMGLLETPMFHEQTVKTEPNQIEDNNEVKFNDAMDIIDNDVVHCDMTLISNETEQNQMIETGALPPAKYEEFQSLIKKTVVAQGSTASNEFLNLESPVVSQDVTKHTVQPENFDETSASLTCITTSKTTAQIANVIKFSMCSCRKSNERNHKSFCFGCLFCGKIFDSLGHLEVHVRCHTGEKPCVCPVCSTGFRQRSHLVNHVSHMHAGDDDAKKRTKKRVKRIGSFRCCFCNLTFDTRGNYKEHISVGHTDLIPSDRRRKNNKKSLRESTKKKKII